MRTVVLTGGTGDLGHAVVPRLARDYEVVVHYRTRASFDRLVTQLGDAATNVRGVESFDDVASTFAVVHLAGGFAAGSSAQTFAEMFEKNVLTAARAVEALAPKLEDGGRIIAISSNAALHKPSGLAAYAASKTALNTVIETLAKDLRKRHITANALLPGAMDTPANAGSMESSQLVPRANVAETIAFLLSDAAANINGQLIELTAR
jgi:NAD(P)-dependent dehydrogenase (short-subunit alcohol dehydrogenase family)